MTEIYNEHILICYKHIRISYNDIGFSSKDILKKQGETDNVLFHLISPLAFTRYSLIHRHFRNQVKAMNGNNLIVALMIL